VKDPERLVVDLEGVEFNSVLQSLPSKISETDPYIKLIRAGRNKPGVVRLVIELKTEIQPQVFMLKPVGEYGHRLVLDLLSAEPDDPLLALLEKSGEGRSSRSPAWEASRPRGKGTGKPERPRVTRMVTIVLDPGHGGEDPGAIGRGGSYEKNVTLSGGAAPQGEDRRRAEHALGADARRRLLHARCSSACRRRAGCRPTSSSRCMPMPSSSRRRAAPACSCSRKRRLELGGALAGAQGERGRPDRRRQPRRQGPYLARTLLDLSQTATINDSLKLGKDVLGELGRINTLHKPHVEQAGFAVLKAPDIPSILIETAFISNPEEERRLNDEAYQDKMAEAILKGIKRYFAKNPPLAKSKLARLD
jgi:N-acetylmuramoyl-L-alanine amidase